MKYLILAIALLVVFTSPASALDWQNETVDNTGAVGDFSSLVFDSSGNPTISYYDITNGDLKYASYNGTGWEIETVDSEDNVGAETSLAFDGSGNPAISYYSNTNYDLKYASYNGTGWEIETVESTGFVGRYGSLAFDDSGKPAISYFDDTNGDLKYASYNGEGWDIETIDSTGLVGLYTSLAFDDSGKPTISYYDNTNYDLKYALYNGESWNIVTVDSTGNVGKFTSLVFDSSGNPAISYFDASNFNVKYSSYNGESWNTVTVDSSGSVGGVGISLALNGSGNPAISYYRTGNFNLNYAAYNGTGWEIETVDVERFAGYRSSLAFDSSDYPAISYYSIMDSALKYASIEIPTSPLPVNSSVVGAWVYVNGTNQSVQTNTTLSLSPGWYNITVMKQYYETPANQTVNISEGSNSGIDFTLIPSLPVAGFTSNVTSGEIALSVSFTDQSVGLVDSWLWDFGDGNTSTAQNPAHVYASAGTYNVSLNATNVGGSNVSTQLSYIVTAAVPVANFSANVTEGAVPLSVNFTDTSINSPTSWQWNFGDGNTSTDQNPNHVYASAGTYNVSLNATNVGGSNVSTQLSYITTAIAPVANFSANVTEGAIAMSVNFTDSSLNSPTSWLWDFGDGNTSTDQNPTHVYASAGIYNVTLNASNVGGSNVSSQLSYITAYTVPVANFSANVTEGAASLSVGFTDSSLNSPISWIWDFGDGNTSTTQNPIHVYASAGAYNVSLNATNIAGSNISTQLSYITVAIAPVANFTASATFGTAPLTVYFTDLSSNDPTSWLWDLGDGSTSTAQNVTHTYTSEGTYTVSLNASNVGGANTSTQTALITVASAPSSSSSSSSGTRASVSQGQDPAIVSSSASAVIRITGDSDVNYDFSGSNSPILGVSFESKEDRGLVVAKVQVLSGSPEGIPSLSDNCYQMMSIDVGSEGTITSGNAENIMIRFKVSKQWIEENNIDVSTIRMTRFHGDQWNDLPTYQEREEGEYVYFYAETPGFSVFSVVGDEVNDTSEQTPATESMAEEVEEPVEESPNTPGFTALAGIMVVSVAYLVSRKYKQG